MKTKSLEKFLIVGIAATTTSEAIRLAKIASQELRVDGVMLGMPPYIRFVEYII
jgi:dihydrodipicolinate synthase/N-acetylneuraminate lyase